MSVLTDSQLFNPKQGGDITFQDMVDEEKILGQSEIQKVFADATVLLTGGTGFLGKLVIEKLLRSCPDIKKIYLVARPKKNKDIMERLQEQFNDVLYDKLRKVNPDFVKKIGIIEGDMGELNLGMSPENRTKLMNEVDMILHGAATVRFDEPLRTAVNINVRGTREMLELAKGCRKLKAFVHISTAYSHCPQNIIGEKFYESPVPASKLIDLVESLDDAAIATITPELLGEFPNTYAFTKAVAEDVILEYSKSGLPLALFRPSIVIGTAREPLSGWIDNVYGPSGVMVGAGVGLLHVLNCEPTAVADLVPGDLVVNAYIATVWKTAQDFAGNQEQSPPELPPRVYNYVSSVQRPLTWKRFMYLTEVYGLGMPTMHAVYHYVFMLIRSKFIYNLWCLLLHWLPAYLFDGAAILIGKKPMLRKAYTKISKFSAVISYFATREWIFDNTNTQNLFNELCDADKQLFDFNMEAISWNDYFVNYVRGIRVYLLKDPMETVPAGLVKRSRLRILHYFITTVFTVLCLSMLYGIFNYVLRFL